MLAVCLSSCDRAGTSPLTDQEAPVGTVWAGPVRTKILEPVQGRWWINLEATGDPRVNDSNGNPRVKLVNEWAILINGHIISFDDSVPESELRLFSVHEHDGWLCGVAWDHEDRHDPGDMSKCLVKLRLEDGQLRLNLRRPGRGVDVSDPDLRAASTVLGTNGAVCPQVGGVDYSWNEWESYEYTRR